MTHAREVELHWGAPVPAHLKHGSNTYASRVYGCSCRSCLPSGRRRPAKGQGAPRREVHRRSRNRLNGRPVPPGVKHGIYTYNVYGCRCDTCRETSARRLYRQRRAWRATAHGRWVEHGDTTTICWPPAGAGPDWACECDAVFDGAAEEAA